MATSLKALTLDPLHLCSSAGDLSLSLISTVHLKFSSITLHASDALHDIDALQLLLSEGLCITTGAECCIEIYLTLDGQEPINHYREYINETATKYFRDLVSYIVWKHNFKCYTEINSHGLSCHFQHPL